MKVERDFEYEQKVALILKNSNPPREGIHQSDLNYCLCKAYLRKQGFQGEADAKGEAVKSAGKGQHDFIEKALERAIGSVSEKSVEFEGIICSIDVLDNGEIVEYKTTRSALKEEVNPSYTEQLKTYCLALGKTSGKLFIFYLIPAEWRIYNVTFTDEELNNKKAELLANRDLLLKALTEKNPQLFPGPRYVWECRFCEFKKICPLKQGA